MKMKVLFTLITLWLCLGGVKVYAQTYIGTEAELRAFATAVNNGTFGTGTAYLIADINLTGSWTPIGNAANQFKGQFEGWGHTISNLNVTGSNDYAGLFGYIDGGSVRDVGIASGGVSGKSCVGGICGYLKAGEISSCYNKTTVSGEDYVGGLCGKSKGTIKNCWHTGNVTATAETSVCAGGLVGCCESGADLLRCYVIVTSISVPDATGENSLFGQVVGEWKGPINVDKLNSCVFNKTDVIVVGFQATDVVFGSYNGSASVKPEAVSVTGATEADMLSKAFWSTRLNVGIESVMEGTLFNQIWVLPLQYGSNDLLEVYPQLNSFENQYGDKKYGSKNKPITFNFTADKQWLTIVPNGNYAVPEGVEAYKVIGVTGSTAGGGTATLSRVYALYEGCPAMVYSTEGTSKTTDNTKTNPTPPTPLNSKGYSDWQGNNLLQGSPTSPDNIGNDGTTIDDLDASVDYVLQNNAFGRVKNGTIARGKAYLHAPFSAGSKLRFVFADESMTSVDAVQESLESDAVWYAMDGRKLEGEPTEKGVYIVNGKKVMIQ